MSLPTSESNVQHPATIDTVDRDGDGNSAIPPAANTTTNLGLLPSDTIDEDNTVANNPTPTQHPPGAASFRKCESNYSPSCHHLAPLAVDLLLLVQQEKLCAIPKRSRDIGKRWAEFYDTVFDGQKNNNGIRDGLGIFRGYLKWTAINASTVKLRPLVMDIIDNFSKNYQNRGDREGTVLELLAETLKNEMAETENTRLTAKDQEFAQMLQNEDSERGLGFRSPGNGVGHASGVPLDGNEREGLAILGQATASICTGRGKFVILFYFIQQQ